MHTYTQVHMNVDIDIDIDIEEQEFTQSYIILSNVQFSGTIWNN